MDMTKIGKFIAALRKEKGYTQEQLAEILGITGKTVSRWETGLYLPPVEMLQALSGEFAVSINELLAGQRLEEEAFRKMADENIVAFARESSFTLAEKKEYLMKKWRRDHVGLAALLLALGVAAWVIPLLMDKTYFFALSALFNILERAWYNNEMMKYMEHHLYDK